jgi:hypothetical protein
VAAGRAGCEARQGALAPIGEHRTGSTVALARWGSRSVALASDEDARSIHAIDLDAKKTLTTLDLDATPGQILVAKDGRVLVALRDRARLAVVHALGGDSPRLAVGCSVETAVEPVGLAATPDDRTVLVTSQWGSKLVSRSGSR